MSWNYRLVRANGQLSLHTVHYDGDTIIAIDEDPVRFALMCFWADEGQTLGQLAAEELAKYQQALTLPVLDGFDCEATPLSLDTLAE